LIKTTIIILLVFVSQWTNAVNFEYQDIDDLNKVLSTFMRDKALSETQPSEIKKPLVIFDIDDTLLASKYFVGSDKWYNWQRGRDMQDPKGSTIRIAETDKFFCLFDFLGTFFDLGDSLSTQPDASSVFNKIKKQPLNLLILTSRSPDYRGATQRELKQNGFDINGLHLMKNNLDLSFYFSEGNRVATITYKNGIVMTAGMDKGRVLMALLNKLDVRTQDIYFVDDNLKNIHNMQQAWKHESVRIHSFHYTHIDKSISTQEIEQSRIVQLKLKNLLTSLNPEKALAIENGKCQ